MIYGDQLAQFLMTLSGFRGHLLVTSLLKYDCLYSCVAVEHVQHPVNCQCGMLIVSVAVATESSHELEQRNAQLRDEQQRRKQLQTQLDELRETTAELSAAKDAADTVFDTSSVTSAFYLRRLIYCSRRLVA